MEKVNGVMIASENGLITLDSDTVYMKRGDLQSTVFECSVWGMGNAYLFLKLHFK